MSKRAIFVAVLGLLLLLTIARPARAGTYTVLECHHTAPVNEAYEGFGESTPVGGPYLVGSDPGTCANAAAEYAIGIHPVADASDGERGVVRFDAPDGTLFTGVDLDARLRSEQGHRARLSMANAAGVEQRRIAAGAPGATGFTHYKWPTTGNPAYPEFNASLSCENAPYPCPVSGAGANAETAIRNLRFTLEDTVRPEVSFFGDGFSGGWRRQEVNLGATASDIGSGLRLLVLSINGDPVAGSTPAPCALVPGTSYGRKLAPCEPLLIRQGTWTTAAPPFREGSNTVSACARDFGSGANQQCAIASIRVDNTPPSLEFSAQDPADPELIDAVASDSTAGLDPSSARIEYRRQGSPTWLPLATELDRGHLKARVDSVHSPPGQYEFRAAVSDMAGNASTTTTRADGMPAVLTFPLKERPDLSAHFSDGSDGVLVPFRDRGQIKGRLRDPSGDPIANAPITVTETFAPGSLIDRRVRTITTNAEGAYSSGLPGGPSRDVAVTYEGSKRYLDASEPGLDFDVRGDASFHTSHRKVKAGKAISFIGRVKRYYAQIPPGGKLVEVQVKSGQDWTTVDHATGTDARGRLVLRHRFRRFYTQPVTFTFRLRVTRENGWPYAGAATSRKRKVTVVPR